MDMDTVVNGLAHELWAIAQGPTSINDAIQPMISVLLDFAADVAKSEREACANFCEQRYMTIGQLLAVEIRTRSN